MLDHVPPFENFDEIPERLRRIIQMLEVEKIHGCCYITEPIPATEKDLLLVHAPACVKNIMTISGKEKKERDAKAELQGRGDLYYSEGSTVAALSAAGAVIQACKLVADRAYTYAFALVRPPGHHATKIKPAGFCLLNNVAIGASYLLRHYRMGKIAIVDFDIHHGNGTQKFFFDDPRVLTFSVHRRDPTFYPAGVGHAREIGKGAGTGFCVNVAWKDKGIKDVDYIAVWDHILIPILTEFKPDIVIVSAGFDAAKGDRLGLCEVSPSGYATLIHKLLVFGPIVLSLEGGYNLDVLPVDVAACIKVLCGDYDAVSNYSGQSPCKNTWESILETRKELRKYWTAFEDENANNVLTNFSEKT